MHGYLCVCVRVRACARANVCARACARLLVCATRAFPVARAMVHRQWHSSWRASSLPQSLGIEERIQAMTWPGDSLTRGLCGLSAYRIPLTVAGL